VHTNENENSQPDSEMALVKTPVESRVVTTSESEAASEIILSVPATAFRAISHFRKLPAPFHFFAGADDFSTLKLFSIVLQLCVNSLSRNESE
jgi:hypothetical protein